MIKFIEFNSKWALYLLVMSFPLGIFLNSFFAITFFLFFFIYFIVGFNSTTDLKLRYFIIASIPFFLPFLSAIFSDNFLESKKAIIRATPILFFSAFSIYRNNWFKDKIIYTFQFLILGCLLSAFFCWGSIIFDLVSNNIPLTNFLSKQYSHHKLSSIVGVHTPYLAIFTNSSLIFMMFAYDKINRGLTKKFYHLIFLILVLFLFHLMARNAIFSFLFSSTVYLIWKKKWMSLTLCSTALTFIFLLILTTNNNLLRDRFIASVNIFEKETTFSKKDKRFERWSNSINVFKKAPIFGVGSGKIDFFRKNEYLNSLDSEAFNNNYNAHNQYIEYLSTYGLVGLLSFLYLITFIFKIIVSKKSIFLMILFFSFFLAMTTESFLVRSWGIYFLGFLYITLYSWE